jgi:ketosteroid isomerase-like protein
MGNEAANVEILKSAYARWNDTKGGSVDHWFAFIAEDIKFGSLAAGAPHVAFTTSYDNRKALRGYFEGLLKDWEMLHFTAGEFVAQGDVVFMRGTTAWRNKRTGKVFESPKVDYWRFRNGKAIEFYEYYDTAGVHAAAVA